VTTPRRLTASLMDRIAAELDVWRGRVGTTNLCFHLVSLDRSRLVCQAVTSGYRATRLAQGLELRDCPGASQALATGGQVVVNESVGSPLVARVAAERYGLRSCVYVPVEGNQPNLREGLLVFSHDHPHAWATEELVLMEQAARRFTELLLERPAGAPADQLDSASGRRMRELMGLAPTLQAVIDREFVVHEAHLRSAFAGGKSLLEWIAHSPRRQEIEQAIADLHDGNLGHASFLLEAGPSCLRLDLAPLHNDEHVEGVGLVCLDVTETLAAKVGVDGRHKSLALGQIAARVAHEFNNVLQGISASVDAVETRVPTEDLAVLRQVIARGVRLAQGLVSFAGTHPVRFRKLKLAALLNEHQEFFQSAIGEEHELIFSLRRSPEIQLDSEQLRMALLNLCLNARDASPSGSPIEILVGESLREGVLCATLAVIDQGCGMSPEVNRRAGEPFFTTKPRGQATGLGLASVQRVMEAHQGWMRIDSAEGKGTTVLLAFPATLPERAPARPAPEPPPEPPRSAVRASVVPVPSADALSVLVVEDEPLIRRFLEVTLLQEGHRPCLAPTLASALELLADHQDWPDLVVLDMTLPDGNGRAVFDTIARIRPDVPFLVCTGFAESSDLDGILAAGHRVLNKPFSQREFLEAVRERLATVGYPR
jgi:signal transduction histidine kinase/CheY-like chemotaxis protein